MKRCRRTFLKFIATACGVAVTHPAELLKGTPGPVAGIRPVRWMLFPTRNHPVFVKAWQQGYILSGKSIGMRRFK